MRELFAFACLFEDRILPKKLAEVFVRSGKCIACNFHRQQLWLYNGNAPRFWMVRR